MEETREQNKVRQNASQIPVNVRKELYKTSTWFVYLTHSLIISSSSSSKVNRSVNGRCTIGSKYASDS